MELNTDFPGHVYCETCVDAFLFLADHYSDNTELHDDSGGDKEWYGERRKNLSKVVDNMTFHHIKSLPENKDPLEKWGVGGKHSAGAARVLKQGHTVLEPVQRPESEPSVRRIEGIKTDYFCFLNADHDQIACRRKSCHCQPCLDSGSDAYKLGRGVCQNYKTCGPWILKRTTTDDTEWDRLFDFLRDEGYNTVKKWNDYCGCYADDQETLTFGCGEGGHLLKCTFCFNSGHMSCCGLGDHRSKAPKGEWACPACMQHASEQLNKD